MDPHDCLINTSGLDETQISLSNKDEDSIRSLVTTDFAISSCGFSSVVFIIGELK